MAIASGPEINPPQNRNLRLLSSKIPQTFFSNNVKQLVQKYIQLVCVSRTAENYNSLSVLVWYIWNIWVMLRHKVQNLKRITEQFKHHAHCSHLVFCSILAPEAPLDFAGLQFCILDDVTGLWKCHIPVGSLRNLKDHISKDFSQHRAVLFGHLGPLLLTCFNFNPNMDK